MLDEAGHDVVGVVGVADGIGAAEEHLEADVGDAFAEFAQAFPWVLLEEAHGGVEGGAAPHLEGEEVGGSVRNGFRDGEHVVGAHAGGDEGLVRVPHGGVGDEEAFFVFDPVGKFGGAFF